MQVTSEAVSGVARRLNVSVPTSRVNEQFEARLKRSAKTVKINGFRPGKVPLNVVRREYGAGIYQEVVNDVIRDTVFEAIQQEKINAVGHAIEAHSFSANLPTETWEAKLLQDADRMEALGAIGLARVFYTSGRMEREMFDSYDPLAKHRQLDDMQFALDHFFVKLYKVADTMQTAAGRKMAEQRRKYLEEYVTQLLTEL